MSRFVTCPYCQSRIDLQNCLVAATNFTRPGSAAAQASPVEGSDDTDDDSIDAASAPADEPLDRSPSLEELQPISGARVLRVVGGQPVVYEPTRGVSDRLTTWAKRGNASLLFERGAPADLPVFLCSQCERPLPGDIETHSIATIGVVGRQGAGKTHFLATSLTAASDGQVLHTLGIDGFRPDEDTSDVFHKKYKVPVYDDLRALGPTLEAKFTQEHPLVFRAKIGGYPYSLRFHDIPGGLITDRKTRNAAISFIHYAQGLIFLVDPWGFKSVRSRLAETYPHLGMGDPGFDQASLIDHIAEEIGDSSRQNLPVAFAITKSDLMFRAFDRINEDLHGEESTDLESRVNEIHELSRIIAHDVLPLFETPALATAMDRFPLATLHLIASLGYQPDDQTRIPKLKPSRISDPLFSILHRLEHR